jgi:hypothetical protein
MWIPSLLSKQAVGLACLIAAILGCRCAGESLLPQRVHFKDARAFREFAAANGLHLHSGTASGDVFAWNNLYVADHPIAIHDLEDVCTRRDCGLTPAWRGILWIAQINDPALRMHEYPESLGGKWRVWGNIMVAGDEDLMDRIEAMYRME